MRKPTKVVVAVALAITALSVTAFAAAAGSNGSGGSSGASGPTAPSTGPIPIDPPIRLMPCGEQTAPDAGPDGTVSFTPCGGDDQPNRPVPTPVVPTPGMDNVRARGWDSSAVGDDGTTVTLTYYTGVPPCTALDHVDVRYGTDTVTITLYEGSDPSAQGTACIDIAMLASTTVHLDRPLGDRTIVDGAQG
jgi:hypothetical protein